MILVLISTVFYFTVMIMPDLTQFYTWEIIVAVVLSIVIGIIFQLRRTMRLKKINVHIQLVED